MRPLLSTVLGRTKFWCQKPRIIEVLLYFVNVGRTKFWPRKPRIIEARIIEVWLYSGTSTIWWQRGLKSVPRSHLDSLILRAFFHYQFHLVRYYLFSIIITYFQFGLSCMFSREKNSREFPAEGQIVELAASYINCLLIYFVALFSKIKYFYKDKNIWFLKRFGNINKHVFFSKTNKRYAYGCIIIKVKHIDLVKYNYSFFLLFGGFIIIILLWWFYDYRHTSTYYFSQNLSDEFIKTKVFKT